MSRLAAGVLIGVAVVVVSVFVVSSVDVSQARDTDGVSPSPQGDAPLSGSAVGVEEGVKPFVGVVISTLSPEEAGERGLQSGVLITQVQDGSPADGKLLEGDVIVAIGPEETTSTEDVIRIVQASTPGDTLTFTVLRGAETIDVAVEVGAREVHTLRFTERLHSLAPSLFGLVPGDFVKAEIVMEVDGVFQTLRVVKGTVESVDVEAGTFVLAPGDGSEVISYTISENTSVNLTRQGDLAGLTAGEEALVVDVDGDVKLVNQGGGLLSPLLEGSLRHGLFPGLRGRDTRLHGISPGLTLLPGLGGLSQLVGRFQFKGGDVEIEETLRLLHESLPESILDHLRELRLAE